MFVINKVFLIISFSVLHLSHSLYQDQVGKFDWRKRYVGCAHQTWFGNMNGQKDVLLVVSKENVIARIDPSSGEIVWRQINQENAVDGLQFHIASVDRNKIIVQHATKQRAFDVNTGSFLWQRATEKHRNESKTKIAEAGNVPFNFDKSMGIIKFDKAQFSIANGNTVKEVKVLLDYRENFQILIHRQDCSLELYEPSEEDAKELQLRWSRHESLAHISDVLMVDLPLSESQAQIETEFNVNEPILRSFLLRIRSQIEQLQRFIVRTSERIVELIMRGELNYSKFFTHFFTANDYRNGRDELPERDYFNMQKMIVVSTLAGTLHGISSATGQVMWTKLLAAENIAPYRGEKLPIFLLRGTAFYQWSSQAAVVFNLKDSPNSVILTFNPITGEQYDRIEIAGGLLRIELSPFVTSEQLHPLILIRNNQPNKVELLPKSQENFKQPKPIFLMFAERETGTLIGNEVVLNEAGTGYLRERWRLALPGDFENKQEIINSIVGKSINEKMHSQGRVLGDRSVLYKYSNPNLVAIFSSNNAESSFRLNLVDSVSGLLIFTGKFSKALPPFHIVHCENWIVLSYWNEKTRRTEFTVVELFEGKRQVNSTAFDSLRPMNEAVKVTFQSYIFPQGVNAMSVTDTEQGLTSRSVLIALPFGGILEMPRRLLDSRRPLELTPEQREEMLIPYIPELPLATEDLINYNQTVAKVRGIRTAPSGLESTSLVFAYGLDLFYTRVMPSGTFDILKDDFDYAFISIVMIGLTVASYICKRITRFQNIQKAWE